MAETSARLAMPLLVPGQAQKELFHNEALAIVDMALQASVVAVALDTPPATPEVGQCWIVGPHPVDAWAGQEGALAGWTAGGWRFVAPVEGMAVWDGAAGQVARRSGGQWIAGILTGTGVVVDGRQVVGARQPGITLADGGATSDDQARAAIAAILAALRTHGLIG